MNVEFYIPLVKKRANEKCSKIHLLPEYCKSDTFLKRAKEWGAKGNLFDNLTDSVEPYPVFLVID